MAKTYQPFQPGELLISKQSFGVSSSKDRHNGVAWFTKGIVFLFVAYEKYPTYENSGWDYKILVNDRMYFTWMARDTNHYKYFRRLRNK